MKSHSSGGTAGSVSPMRRVAQKPPVESNGRSDPGPVTVGFTARGCIGIQSVDAVMRPLKTAEFVARYIVQDIVRKGLATGDSLPSEAAMLEHYSVSRESLREGLRLLEVQGLISIRRGPGGGPIVGTVDPANMGRVSTLYFYMAGATYDELFEAWVIGESLLAERAARHPDTELRQAAMAPYLADHFPHAAAQTEVILHQNTEFHSVIAGLSNNRVLELTLPVYGKIVSHHVAVVNDPRALDDLIAGDHRAIAQAISGGHHRRAADLMTAHINAVAEFTRARLGDKVNDFIEWL